MLLTCLPARPSACLPAINVSVLCRRLQGHRRRPGGVLQPVRHGGGPGAAHQQGGWVAPPRMSPPLLPQVAAAFWDCMVVTAVIAVSGLGWGVPATSSARSTLCWFGWPRVPLCCFRRCVDLVLPACPAACLPPQASSTPSATSSLTAWKPWSGRARSPAHVRRRQRSRRHLSGCLVPASLPVRWPRPAHPACLTTRRLGPTPRHASPPPALPARRADGPHAIHRCRHQRR